MKANIYVTYDNKENEYQVSSPELAPYGIVSFVGIELPFAIEEFFHGLQNQIRGYEGIAMGNNYDNEIEVIKEDLQALTGLELSVIVKFSLDKEKQMYINAVNLMLKQHAGQKDKAGKDYYFHPMRVSMKCNLIESKTVALLHDIVEDTTMTFEKLRIAQFSEEIINGVRAVTRMDGESYADFIERASKDELGHAVKSYDLEDNLNITRLSNIGEKDWHRLNKYLHAWRYLTGLDTTTENIKE
jgi:hypothetical protein